MNRSDKRSRRILVWMRRALHVQDNLPLWNAMRDADEVVPVLVLGTGPSYRLNSPRRLFIRRAIRDLDENLRRVGSGLVLATGDPVLALPALALQYHADAVYAARVYDPSLSAREQKIAAALSSAGVRWETFKESALFESGEITTAQGAPYRVYTPYMRAVRQLEDETPPVLPAIRSIRSPFLGGLSLSRIPGFRSNDAPGGETAARARLRAFLNARVQTYARRRDFPAIDGTSRLSADLAIGTISIRTVFHAARRRRDAASGAGHKSIDAFINELIWREFYYQILAQFPFVVHQSFREEFRGIAWRTNARRFDAWCSGQTGYPIVDAAMRQLNAEGWMHNRARMIVASFLTKDLHIDWREGERYFFSRLVDADVASNNGGWQWAAGTGTDASPYFRIFNPVLQAKRFDPKGDYVRRYVPELDRVPTPHIHEPWRLSREDQRAFRCVIGRDYPLPIVDHGKERDVTMRMYSRAARRRGKVR